MLEKYPENSLKIRFYLPKRHLAENLSGCGHLVLFTESSHFVIYPAFIFMTKYANNFSHLATKMYFVTIMSWLYPKQVENSGDTRRRSDISTLRFLIDEHARRFFRDSISRLHGLIRNMHVEINWKFLGKFKKSIGLKEVKKNV